MTVSFENSYVILSQERAEHINERHVGHSFSKQIRLILNRWL